MSYIWKKTVLVYDDNTCVESEPELEKTAKGEDGSSAYDVAVSNGFVGTEEEWLESLRGESGATGATGATGTGVSSITEEYYLSTSKTSQTGGSWTTTPPTWSNGMYVWTRSKIVYTNPSSTAYTTPICDSSWEAVDNMEIGGRNLFKYNGCTDNEYQLRDYKNTGSFTQFYSCLTFDPKETVGDKYTISFYAKSPNGNTKLALYNRNGNPRYFYFDSVLLDNALGTEWKYYTYTITNVDMGSSYEDDDSRNRCIEIYAPDQKGVLVKKIKIERGNKPTDWTPAPEDVDNDISEAAKTATNFIDYQDGTGLIVGDMTEDILGKNTLIDANGMAVRDGSSELARFGSNRIELGKNSECSEIKFCNDSGAIVSTDEYVGMGAYRTTDADPSDFCGMMIHNDGTTIFNGETVEVHNTLGNKIAINSEGVDIYKGSEKAGHFGSDGLYLNRGIYHRKSDRPSASIGDELPASNYCFGGRYCYDSNGTAVNFSESWLYNDGTMFSSFVTRRKDSEGDNYNNGLYLYLDPDGSPRVGFTTNPAGSCATAWRDALISKLTYRLSEAPSLTTSSTKLMFESVLSERDSGSRISSYNGGLKFSVDGYIYLSTTLRASSVAASAYIQLDIYRGTTNTNCKAFGFNGNSKAYWVTMNSDAVLRVSAGDVIYLYAKTSSGTASMIADAGNRLTAIYI